jgi:5'-nucleotidase
VTNDDGVDSRGLWALASAAIDAGFDVVVAAPSWDSSGSSASLTAVWEDGQFLMERRDLAALPDTEVYAVEAAPAFIVRASMDGSFGPPPDLVLSGINAGLNIGQSVLHSGTVGAALTAATWRRRALAVSIALDEPQHWATAAHVAGGMLRWVSEAQEGVVINLNVPNVPEAELRGVERGHLSSPGIVHTVVTERDGGHVKLVFSQDGQVDPGTDAALLQDGFAAVTPLQAPCESTALDTTGLDPPRRRTRT